VRFSRSGKIERKKRLSSKLRILPFHSDRAEYSAGAANRSIQPAPREIVPNARCGRRAFAVRLAYGRLCRGAVKKGRQNGCLLSRPILARRTFLCDIDRWFLAHGRRSVERAMMQIWPAIDVRGGKCVRLRQGDYDQETIFGDDPNAMARRWIDQGAQRLHVVDLDGARQGVDASARSPNGDAIAALVRAVDVPIQIGGGVRSEATIAALLDLGAARLVVGTLALRQPDWFRRMCRKFPDRLALGVDARDGRVATEGWLATSDVSAVELARSWANEPICAIIYTDIATDGMLQGPNVAAMAEMRSAIDVPVIASGGVSCRDDVARLEAAGMAGCIVGRALYEGKLSIADARSAGREEQTST
jgi:phosphoribosylformimino-5-aminoimidazole carboxamide ribotide isomerase